MLTAISRGKFIHLLHGDDCVRDGFYRKLQRGFEKNSQVGAAFCRHIFMDQHSHWQYISPLEQSQSSVLNNWLERIAVEQRIQTPSIVVRRDVYEHLGGFDRRISCWGEDWEMWVRIAAHYTVWYEVEPLALYRRSSTSLTGQSVRSGKNIQDFRKAINIVNEYLRTERTNELKQTALRNYAFNALGSAEEFVGKGDAYGAINQIREAFLCNSSLKIAIYSLKLGIKLFSKMIFS
ncbi:glycosyltransferase [Nostoc sphaeroides CHAB 2801]|uniref:glycosyltransferase n=1 Tax=Nostoc sphaeroides TaxID=446679 RepID=UPI001E3BA83C|nr:glycosyltransferase [Nostoc sphaeroides]MCC5632348.1 glycosyltransferase [Nostoc sphaeroides CHAB 2801]